VTDGKITITKENADKIEGQLDQLGKDLKTAKDAEKAAKDAQADLQTKLDKALKDVQERDQQIANLKKAPGAEDEVPAGEHVDEGDGEITAQSMLNEIKNM
jgi:chromosome segregation ATPase